MNNKMHEYIEAERAKGISDADIKIALAKKGWKKKHIEILFAPPKPPINWSTYFIGSSLFIGRMNNIHFSIVYLVAMVMHLMYLNTTSVLFKSIALMLFFIILIGVWVRRFHDINRSGLWVIVLFIPGVNLFAGLYLCYKKGDENINAHGAPEIPKRNFMKSLLNI